MNCKKAVVEYLTSNSKELASELVANILDRFHIEIPQQEIDNSINVYNEFFGFLGDLLEGSEEEAPATLIQWSRANGEREASQGGNVSEVLIRYPATRIVFSKLLTRIGKEHQLTVDDMVWMITRVNYLLDLSLNETVFAFERLSEKLLRESKEEIYILSAPVVPIQNGLAILPLVGSMDHDRATHIMENAIPKVAQHKFRCLIIDFSGIVNIDATIARHIYDFYNVLRLLGIECIATGIRPEMAFAAVEAGINFSAIKTFANVRQAVESFNTEI
ncbi:STAS domain-containing protein [Mesobacillus zeae]|uniref:STAS domain-containing protein n=1 Tax=Mesobacillus zeae TaxID=1917180 RepID=A0A398AV87_9BACI|nr:STAS domain-containing protein [Mesobacillus zeae]RID81532.1 STAS domain-containing protein [Mesobacillus zeae]